VEEHGPITRLEFREVVAVVQEVPLETFIGPSAEARLQDLAWVGPRACRHEEVVERVMRHSPVFPARFGTLFSAPQQVEALLESHYGAVLTFLDHVADKEEWAVKGLVDRAAAEARLLAEADLAEASSPGTRYLLERRGQARAEKRVNSWLREASAGIAARLESSAVGSTPLRALPRETSGREADIAFNWAFLVLRRSRGDFRVQVEGLSAGHLGQGLRLELSGPWPPYSFCPSLGAPEKVDSPR
jgi:hypothetical protein